MSTRFAGFTSGRGIHYNFFVGDGALTKYGVRFTNQVWPGDTLTSTATIIDIREQDGERVVDLQIETTNQNDIAVITGNATAKIES